MSIVSDFFFRSSVYTAVQSLQFLPSQPSEQSLQPLRSPQSTQSQQPPQSLQSLQYLLANHSTHMQLPWSKISKSSQGWTTVAKATQMLRICLTYVLESMTDEDV